MKITIEGTEQEIKNILSTIGSSQEDKKQISVKSGDGFINPQNTGVTIESSKEQNISLKIDSKKIGDSVVGAIHE